MFEQLPETVPSKNKRKFEAFGAAFAVQVALVAGLIVLQMAMPEKLGEFQLLTTLYMAAPPPPPPAAPASAAPEPVRRAQPKPASVNPTPAVVSEPRPVEKEPEVIAPTTIPKDIARVSEVGSPSASGTAAGGVPGGIRGGLPGGVSGGILGGILGGAGAAVPPPPPPPAPVRVGGNVKPPKVIHIEQPQYPPAAKKAGVEGVVVVEATVTANGSVDKVKVISGPPLLTEAATEAVSRWKYEPTYLNGEAVPVILTARINFSLSNSEK